MRLRHPAWNIPGSKDFQTVQRDDTLGFQGEEDWGSQAIWAMVDPPLYPSGLNILPVSNLTSNTAQSCQNILSSARCVSLSYSWPSQASPRLPSSKRGPADGRCASTRWTPMDDTSWVSASPAQIVTALNHWTEKTAWPKWKLGRHSDLPSREVERW